jgi:hypothetical protein
VRKAIFILSFFLSLSSAAQSLNDSLPKRDTNLVKKDSSPIRLAKPKVPRPKDNIPPKSDSILKARDSISRDSSLRLRDNIIKDSISGDSFKRDSIILSEEKIFLKRFDSAIYNHNPFYAFKNPTRHMAIERQGRGKEGVFYSIIALLLFFALAKNTFSRYLDDLFRVFFRTTLKQRQTRDQLMSAPLPSLLFNILYGLSAALFVTLLLQHFHLGDKYNFWLLFAYSIAGIGVVYSIKFISLKFFGWMLGVSEATNTYIFIVFTANKLMGILLLPFIVGLAFMDSNFYDVVFSLSLCVLGALLVYRFYLSFISIRKQMVINFFHFILYMIALEIIPLLLINKLLVRFFSETH